MTDKTRDRILRAVLLLGLIGALLLCAFRIALETKNSSVCVVMTDSAAAQVGGLPNGVRLFDGEPFLDDAVLLIEDERQYSFEPDGRIDVLMEQFPIGNESGVAYARCFHLTEKYAARYGALGYDGAEEIENILYRAVTDRNIRVLWLEPFTDANSGETITDGAEYSALLERLSARLARHGLSLGDEFSVFPAYTPSLPLLILCAFGICAAGVLLLTEGFGMKKKLALPVLAFACVVSVLLLGAGRDAAIRIGAIAAAVLFPCLAATLLVERLRCAKRAGLGAELGAVASTAVLCWLLALAGGLFVAALQSDTRWLLAIKNFRGVKLALILPLLFAAWLILRRLSTLREIGSGKKYLIILAAVAAIVVLLVVLLRSGDGVLPVAQAEQRLRNALEHILIVRPRTKEFLFAWPSFGIAWILCRRGGKKRAWPFVLLSTVGFASVVNSFCHSRAPIWVSAVRSALGLLIGLAIALILTALFHRSAEKLTGK